MLLCPDHPPDTPKHTTLFHPSLRRIDPSKHQASSAVNQRPLPELTLFDRPDQALAVHSRNPIKTITPPPPQLGRQHRQTQRWPASQSTSRPVVSPTLTSRDNSRPFTLPNPAPPACPSPLAHPASCPVLSTTARHLLRLAYPPSFTLTYDHDISNSIIYRRHSPPGS